MTTTQTTPITPKLSVEKTQIGQMITIKIIVKNANQKLISLLDSLGYATGATANYRYIECTTPEQVNAARNPLVSLFDRTGSYVGGAR